jgi:hypothetical protein
VSGGQEGFFSHRPRGRENIEGGGEFLRPDSYICFSKAFLAFG